jgi:muconate cycloisomerase
MAWYDLLGKHLGVPVWYLLGRKLIDQVPIDYWMGRCNPEETFERTQIALESGFLSMKMKCKLGDPIVERVRAVRAAAPEFSIILDPNDRFETVEDTKRISKSLAEFDDLILESPVPQHRLDWYAALRKEIAHPIALHLTSLSQLLAALKADAADCYNLLGPLYDFTQWARIAVAAGYPTLRGTGMDLGIRDMSSVHAAAAAGCRLPSGMIGHILREDDLIVDPIPFESGCLIVPDLPGLGIELDRNALEHYRVDESR